MNMGQTLTDLWRSLNTVVGFQVPFGKGDCCECTMNASEESRMRDWGLSVEVLEISMSNFTEKDHIET